MIKTLKLKLNVISKIFYEKINESYIGNLKNKKIIWHASTMRSGSSFLNYFIDNFSKFKTFNINNKKVTLNDNIEINFVAKQLMEKSNNNYWISRNSHFCPNLYNSGNLRKEDVVIVQYRNILDTILSLYNFSKDKIKNNEYNIVFPYDSKNFSKINDDEKISLLIYKYIPFHLDFLLSWMSYSKSKKIFVSYEDGLREIIENKLEEIISFKDFEDKEFKVKKASSNSNDRLDKKKVLNKIEDYIKVFNLDSKSKDLLFQKIK